MSKRERKKHRMEEYQLVYETFFPEWKEEEELRVEADAKELVKVIQKEIAN